VAESLLRRHGQVIDADLSKYFDTIPHAKLLAVVAERICDGGILWLIKQWLKAAIVEEGKDGKLRTTGGGKGNRLGTPQGGVISPLLANLYLHLLDRIWERRDLAKQYGARIVRYADDLVILCTGSVHRPLDTLRYVLDRLDLRLNDKKTRIVNAYKESFDFLGFSFCLRKSRKSGKLYPHVEPSRRSVQRIKDRMKTMTDRKRTPIPLPVLVEEVNMSLRGWSGYFHYRNCTGVFGEVKWHVEERMRTHLRRRFKLHSRAQAQHHLPSSKLYGRYNLYKPPTTAAWRKANAL